MIWKKILSINATLSVLLMVQRTILYWKKNTDFDDFKSKSDSEELDSKCKESD